MLRVNASLGRPCLVSLGVCSRRKAAMTQVTRVMPECRVSCKRDTSLRQMQLQVSMTACLIQHHHGVAIWCPQCLYSSSVDARKAGQGDVSRSGQLGFDDVCGLAGIIRALGTLRPLQLQLLSHCQEQSCNILWRAVAVHWLVCTTHACQNKSSGLWLRQDMCISPDPLADVGHTRATLIMLQP